MEKDYVNNEEPFGLVRPDLRQIIFHCFADDDEESYEISVDFDKNKRGKYGKE